MKVIKRDGSTADFDSSKIIVAIQKANQVVEPEDRIDQERIEAIAHYVESKNRMRLLVEDIQDMVETGIMEMRGYEVAQKYVRYRYKRELARKSNTTDNGILALIDHMNEEVNQENSNKNPVINSTIWPVRFPRISQRECCCRRISWKHTRPESYISTIQITMHRRSITVTSSISRTCCRMEPSSARL